MNNESSKGQRLSKAMEKVCGIVEQTYYQERTLYDLTNKVSKNKVEIKKELGRKDSMTVRNLDGNEFLVSSKPDVKMEFDVVKMQKTLDKERFNKATNKKVIVHDLEGLITYLKSQGVSAKKFKEYITVEHEVDADKLDHLVDIEEVTVAEAQEFTDISFEDVITIKKVK